MIRGTTTFKCYDCGKVFRAMDIEWCATCYSVPMPCPKCGSRYTYVPSIFNLGGLLGPGFYRKIWEMNDKK